MGRLRYYSGIAELDFDVATGAEPRILVGVAGAEFRERRLEDQRRRSSEQAELEKIPCIQEVKNGKSQNVDERRLWMIDISHNCFNDSIGGDA